MAWDLALPVGNRFLVTVAGEKYAGFNWPRTVTAPASGSSDCLSPRAKSISQERIQQSRGEGRMPNGAIVGTALGAAALVLAAVLIAWLLRRRRAPAVRPGEINLQDEWQSVSHEQYQLLPFPAKPKATGEGAAHSEAGPSASTAVPGTPEPLQEVDAEAPMRCAGPAPPSYTHVLWVTNADNGNAGESSTSPDTKAMPRR